MALSKTIITPSGSASFWVISSVTRDTFSKFAHAQLRGYASRESCDKNEICLANYGYDILPNTFNDYFDVDEIKADGVCDIGQFYKFIKQYDVRFSDAEDLIY